jgi:hypothetical protein
LTWRAKAMPQIVLPTGEAYFRAMFPPCDFDRLGGAKHRLPRPTAVLSTVDCRGLGAALSSRGSRASQRRAREFLRPSSTTYPLSGDGTPRIYLVRNRHSNPMARSRTQYPCVERPTQLEFTACQLRLEGEIIVTIWTTKGRGVSMVGGEDNTRLRTVLSPH